MSKQAIEVALKTFDERYCKRRIDKESLDIFGNNMFLYIKQINEAVKADESEEHIKGIINSFLRHSFYNNEIFDINTYKRADCSIKFKGVLHTIIEVKKPQNHSEMVFVDNINKKALWEIVLYYLIETRMVDGKKVKNNPNSEIRRLVITDSRDWFIINAQDIDKICNGYLEQQFYKYQNGLLSFSNDTDKFYALIADYFEQIDITNKLNFVYFRFDEVYSHRSQWQYMYKILHPAYLIKNGYKQLPETHVLNSRFYKELLYIMGLKEEKIDGKNQIVVDESVNDSLIKQSLKILKEDKGYGDEKALNIAFQLVIIWVNRLLFIKLFEGQLLSFNGDEACYHILDNDKITSFQEMQDLFFEVFGKKNRSDEVFIHQFDKIPYLNSSLFERYEVEKQNINIRAIENKPIMVKSGTVLGKKITKLPLLEYFIDFLNAYSFSAQNDTDGTVKSRNEIIDASVLGLIFEKINGYKEGSFYTKGFVTEYICKETIENTIIDKVNEEFGWEAKTIEDLKMCINLGSADEIRRINDTINAIKICDPAVGSGHFLVSAMNRIIATKKELGVLLKADGAGRFSEYDIAVIDDILCVFDGQGNEFRYNPKDALSQLIQKTLFNEKRKIIENCLFGVDINSNAVAICQLRLWIELLKNAYYENGIMETLPNIDINIKCGNSLIHKMPFQVGKIIGKNNKTLSNSDLKLIRVYKNAVLSYKSSTDKEEKRRVKTAINDVRSKLHSAYDQLMLKVDDSGMMMPVSQASNDKLFYIYSNAFEWAIEFPEIIGDDGVFLGFDCMIGNPPYIRVQELDHNEIDYYKNTYSTAWKRLDISTLFIELANGLISKNGRITYITSNQFISTEYGRMIRKYISDNRLIETMVDFGDLPVFDGALTYVSIFFMNRNTYKRSVLKYYKVPELPFVVPKSKQFIGVDYDDLGEEMWELESPEEKKCLKTIRSAAQKTLGEYANCWAGAITGYDEGLMFDIGKPNPIDDKLQISVVRAEGCSRYGKAKPTKVIYYPYIEQGDDTVIIPIDDIKEKYPNTYNYIMEHEKKIKSRKDSRKTFGDRVDWHGLIRFGKLSRFHQIKIVSPGEVRHNKFCIDETGSAFSCARVFSINIEDEQLDIRYLLAILNSKLCEYYLHKTTSVKAGGYYSYSSKAINSIPLVIDNGEYQTILINLVNDIMMKVENGEDTIELESKIDKIVYRLYCLNDEEIKIIESSVIE